MHSLDPRYQQNFLELSVIQGASVGLPAIIAGSSLTELYGAGVTCCSIVIGNFALWLIGLSIISMVSQRTMNAIENIKEYLGKIGAFIAACSLFLIFIAWFILQLRATTTCVQENLKFSFLLEKTTILWIGGAVGILIAFISYWGIHVFKWLCIAIMPLLVIFDFWIIAHSSNSIEFSSFGLSAPAIATAIALFFPTMINLPTFFRYSRSKADSCLAITLMIGYYTFFELSGMWIDCKHMIPSVFSTQHNLFLLLFLLLLLLCGNLLNLYLSTACYQSFSPKLSEAKGRVFAGISGSLLYVLFHFSPSINLIISLLNSYLITLGVVLILSFLVRIVVQHRPRPQETRLNTFVWISSCAYITFLKMTTQYEDTHLFLIGTQCVCLLFLFLIYLEESFWSLKQSLKKTNHT